MALSTCTPNDILDEAPCLSCLSLHELMAVLVYLLSVLEGTYTLPAQLSALLDASACHKCTSDKQKLEGIDAILASELTQETVEQLRDRIRCMVCLDPDSLKAAAIYLICRYGITLR